MPAFTFACRLINSEFSTWPATLRRLIKPYWQKTLTDDENGLISGVSMALGEALGLTESAGKSAAASLLLWTAANLQDDVLDEDNAPRSNGLLSEACLISAARIIGRHFFSGRYLRLLLESSAANADELEHVPPANEVSACGKSVFLIAPLLYLASGRISAEEINRLESALRFSLAAKQLADDVYDYQEDWLKGKRSLAHEGLSSLPTTAELPAYFHRYARRILNLCSKSRKIIKKIPMLSDRDILSPLIATVEANCQKCLASLSLPDPIGHTETRTH
ncbi:MAG: hypothetical protein ACM3PZ_01525 [Bacillota bacterium]